MLKIEGVFKMKSSSRKKLSAILLCIVLFAAASVNTAITSFAQSADISKTQLANSNTYYEYNSETKTLVLSGSGATPNLSDTAASIPWYYWRATDIDRVVIEEGITALGNNLLYQVRAKEITLPSTLKRIGNSALAYTLGVTKWEIPFGVTSIGSSAFAGCAAMTQISLPKTLTTIGSKAFYNCTSLKEITIPYGVKTVASEAFKSCTSLERAEFQSLTATVTLSGNLFTGCEKLTYLAVPMHAKCSAKFYGYNTNGKLYDNVKLGVFDSSNAQIYAETNKYSATLKPMNYELLDTIPAQCGVEYKNTYTEAESEKEYTFVFTADADRVYNFYSRGVCDVRASLYDSSAKLIGENDDIADSKAEERDLNFCIPAQLKKGETYYLKVSSRKSQGEFSVWIYPDGIDSFDVKGALAFSAADRGENGQFPIKDDMLTDFILTVKYNTGFVDKMYYKAGYFDAKTMKYNNTQDSAPFTCGDNTAQLAIGSVTGGFNVRIEHSYAQTVVEPTVDDDGYTLYKCILCGDSYKDDFVETTAVTVRGQAVLMQTKNGGHDDNIPYPYVTFEANSRTYTTDENGNWSFNTFDSCDITFKNPYGADVTVHIEVNGEDVDYGAIAFMGYDFNNDNHVNGIDYAIFRHSKRFELGERYFDRAENFML